MKIATKEAKKGQVSEKIAARNQIIGSAVMSVTLIVLFNVLITTFHNIL
jgi:hypothetical protein